MNDFIKLTFLINKYNKILQELQMQYNKKKYGKEMRLYSKEDIGIKKHTRLQLHIAKA